jgi:L-2-hydroxyglutarate oxidase LhgO
MEKADIVIIGAGVVGLAVGARLSQRYKNLYVLERHNTFGQETSSRNSEVIHAGIYYPAGSFKARFCVEGNRMLYELCTKAGIKHKRIEKLIVATDREEEEGLTNLLIKGRTNGAKALKIISGKELKKLEPNINGVTALHSPSTGIIDTHGVMTYLESRIKENGGELVYNCNVTRLTKLSNGYEVGVKDASGEFFKFYSRTVVNCAGLESDQIAQLTGIDIDKNNYRLKYCQGQYFRVINPYKCSLVSRLIYPLPQEKMASLGIHIAKDLAGGMRLGPDAHYIDRESFNYEVDVSQRGVFLTAALRFLPFLEEKDLLPDTCGIRPKLQGEGDGFRDFVIKEESNLGFPAFINLIGIESPGFTAALAIAKYVEELIKPFLS